jgi:hypothetical protein
MTSYHIGLIRGSSRCFLFHDNGYSAETLVVEMRHNIDALSCDLWVYGGVLEITKRQMFLNRFDFLHRVNSHHRTDFKRIVID